ncbi:molybdenum cofactor guanylyltransferase [Sphingomonas sp. AP4-R1]|uniref:molybdenum cofactor guanylyltransferase n=1 Tax=Sphingomonas sp. AP4-R1 TaxID=2735134 RepID=UPI00149377A4|nr:molybdenum cofactor guanylyltransferase [Sphingomonas sp. AP4-R1]QJU58560.1 molybdenum cofactor guanylyltransferase [Sphingomonas sp. AP4-R1]
MRILGAILAGGRSSRFGSDKAEAMLEGRRLIDWAHDCMAGHVDHIVVCGRPGGIADRPHPDLGPLGGINAALHHARDRGFEAVLTVPCDVPILPSGTMRRLADAPSQAFLRSLPVVARWDASFADQLDRHLEGEERSVARWARRIGSLPISADDDIDNVNTPADLERLSTRRAGLRR